MLRRTVAAVGGIRHIPVSRRVGVGACVKATDTGRTLRRRVASSRAAGRIGRTGVSTASPKSRRNGNHRDNPGRPP